MLCYIVVICVLKLFPARVPHKQCLTVLRRVVAGQVQEEKAAEERPGKSREVRSLHHG